MGLNLTLIQENKKEEADICNTQIRVFYAILP